jgi:hypothetical protein
MAKDTKDELIKAANTIKPPMVGTERWWIFLVSVGSSTKCLRLATAMSEGMPTSVAQNASKQVRISDNMVAQR